MRLNNTVSKTLLSALQTPPALVQDLLAAKKAILTTDCVYLDDRGQPTESHCDGSAWAETDASRAYLKTVDPRKPLLLDYGGACPPCAGLSIIRGHGDSFADAFLCNNWWASECVRNLVC